MASEQNGTPPTCKQSLQVGRETTDDDRRRAAMRDIDGILAATGWIMFGLFAAALLIRWVTM
jgi:hypothetical protein